MLARANTHRRPGSKMSDDYHPYVTCTDADCPLRYCQIWKEGFSVGFEAGYDSGYAEGCADEAATAGDQ